MYTQTWFDQATGSDPGLNQEEEKEKFRSNGARTVCDLAKVFPIIKLSLVKAPIYYLEVVMLEEIGRMRWVLPRVTSIELNVTTIGADGRTWDLGQNAQQGEISAGVCSTRSCREAEFGWNKYSPNGDGTASKTELSSGGTGINDKNRSLSNGRIQKMDVSKTKTE